MKAQFIYENISEKRFRVDKKNFIFKLFLGRTLVSKSNFSIEKPDELYDKKYVGIFKLGTKKEYRGKGFAKDLLENIFDYVKNELKIDHILLNVYKDNTNAVNLYFNTGFKIYKSYEEEDPYLTLIKNL